VTFDVSGVRVVFKSTIPSSEHTYLISDCNYPIDRFDKIIGMPKLELDFCTMFCDGLPTVLYSVVSRHKSPVLRVERGDGGGIVAFVCFLILHSQNTNLLDYFWIYRVFLLSEGRQNKADCQTCEGNC
jgi:hypothetical protein